MHMLQMSSDTTYFVAHVTDKFSVVVVFVLVCIEFLYRTKNAATHLTRQILHTAMHATHVASKMRLTAERFIAYPE